MCHGPAAVTLSQNEKPHGDNGRKPENAHRATAITIASAITIPTINLAKKVEKYIVSSFT
jgi:hypothetical protein